MKGCVGDFLVVEWCVIHDCPHAMCPTPERVTEEREKRLADIRLQAKVDALFGLPDMAWLLSEVERLEKALNSENHHAEGQELKRENAVLRERIRVLEEAGRHALEWLEMEGCDCGTDEPGTCALCEMRAALAAEGEE